MVEEDGKPQNETTVEQEGKEDIKPVSENLEVDQGISPLDRLEAANKEKASLLEIESKNLEKRERIVAAESASGRARMGTQISTPEKSAAEYTKEVMEGKHGHAE